MSCCSRVLLEFKLCLGVLPEGLSVYIGFLGTRKAKKVCLYYLSYPQLHSLIEASTKKKTKKHYKSFQSDWCSFVWTCLNAGLKHKLQASCTFVEHANHLSELRNAESTCWACIGRFSCIPETNNNNLWILVDSVSCSRKIIWMSFGFGNFRFACVIHIYSADHTLHHFEGDLEAQAAQSLWDFDAFHFSVLLVSMVSWEIDHPTVTTRRLVTVLLKDFLEPFTLRQRETIVPHRSEGTVPLSCGGAAILKCIEKWAVRSLR